MSDSASCVRRLPRALLVRAHSTHEGLDKQEHLNAPAELHLQVLGWAPSPAPVSVNAAEQSLERRFSWVAAQAAPEQGSDTGDGPHSGEGHRERGAHQDRRSFRYANNRRPRL